MSFAEVVLEQGKADGESYLRRILDEPENELIPDACQVLAQHFQATGQRVELRQVYDQLGRYQRAQAEAYRERTTVTTRDLFLRPELEASDRESLQAILAAESELAEAYLVRKELKHVAQLPLYVLCVRTQPGFLGRSHAARDAALVERLIPQVRLPGRVLIISPHRSFRPLARKIMGMPEARVHPA